MNQECTKSGELSKSVLIKNGEVKITPTTTTKANDGSAKSRINDKKKRGAFGLLKAALVKWRRSPSEKSKQAKKEALTAKEKWKKLVGSMRPLHLQENHPSPPRSEGPMSRASTVDSLEDMMTPYSPAPSYSSAFTGGTMSQYASANNLQELDKPEGTMSQNASSGNLQELDKLHDGTMSQNGSACNLQELQGGLEKEEDPDEMFESISGDEMIDVKAEAFIAQFYQQMKLDQSYHHCHHDPKGKNKM